MTEPERIVPQPYFYDPPVDRPTTRTWLKHLALLALTFCTVTVAGSIFPFGPYQTLPDADPQNLQELISLLFSLPAHYALLVGGAVQALFQQPGYLAYGLKFAASLLFILTCHEMGHYIACRLYKVDATLPFFIPLPPMIGPAGTFGAFIKIRSPLPSRRAVFDIGVAGPIAGFLALLPIAAIGVITMQSAPPGLAEAPGSLVFSDPLLMRVLGGLVGVDPSAGVGNPFYFAAWVGLLVTALNLIPSGQLDGGHAVYAVFGEGIHRMTGRIAFPVMAVLSVVGLVFYGSPSGFLITIILGVMMRVKHPEPWDQTPLDTKRKVLAFATLIIFVLCFVPFPIRIS
jgi:membrane-associated protease RseP (regulator of RpoE activity)